MKEILVINQGNLNNNLGDLAIRENIAELIEHNNFGGTYAFLTNPSSNKIPLPIEDCLPVTNNESLMAKPKKKSRHPALKFLQVLAWPIKNYRAIKVILKSRHFDKVIIGGGQLINSSHSIHPHNFAISIFWWTIFLKIFTKSEIVYFAIGIDEGFNFVERFMYKTSLRRASKIYVRDSYSKAQLNDIFKIQGILMPDVAFYSKLSITQKLNKNLLFGIYSFDEYDANYNGDGISKDEYFEMWTEILLNFQKENYLINLFYTTLTDYQESLEFKKYLFERHKIQVNMVVYNSLQELFDLYKDSSCVYSARMHALILASKYGCECIPFLISQKLVSFNDEYLKKNDFGSLSKKVEHAFFNIMNN